MSTTAPYGTWPSPITPGTITTRTVRLSQVRVDGPDTYWVEQRASQAGRQVLLRRDGDGQIGEVLPLTPSDELVDVRTRVHEYGGRAYAVDGGIIVVSHAGDGRLYRFDVAHRMRGLVPLTIYGDVRHGDLEIDTQRGLVYAVREDHRGPGEPVNTLVAIPLDGSAARDDEGVRTVVSGTDFVVSPTLSPDGEHLAWVCWDQPGMPWDEARLYVGDLRPDGTLGEQTVVDGGAGHGAGEPRWTEECELVHVANGSGYWNLYRTEGFPRRGTNRTGWTAGLRTRPLHPAEATFSSPAWTLGPHHFDVLDGEHLIASWSRDGVWHLGTVKLSNGELEEWNVGWQPAGNVASSSGRVVLLAGSEIGLPSIVEVKGREVVVLRGSGEFTAERDGISFADPLSWPTSDGATAHGFFYPPTSATHAAPAGELPPLVVGAHGGPTEMARPGYDLTIQFWTSRGFAYLDVNYRGSSGYGSAYRQALNGNWGVYDADDVASGAQFLIDAGRVDPARVAVRGASAGGFTALQALVRSEVFSAGTSLFGIADLARLVGTTHKFESRYIETLTGASGPEDPVLVERSPLNHIEDIHAPLLLLQGSEDPIVPAEQATAMYEAVRATGQPVALEVFHGEGHGFRMAASIHRAYHSELSFYTQVWGIDSPEKDRGSVTIDNLGNRTTGETPTDPR
ncbi:MAG: prolyl oligopeptidase family serine peptidase [Actinomyces sp.]|uniref:alpha/beta hydrolase family protein n=1 Tax=Actinomyces sp. TaxID=29317 RepID=UPI0026DB6133|nr:prolyl oligopeptidase family serine peptidase [Actinomyces sp.]MDO4242557.1 prolyl oligopeptidase family serine peptidase [Actinomyces sp.]